MLSKVLQVSNQTSFEISEGGVGSSKLLCFDDVRGRKTAPRDNDVMGLVRVPKVKSLHVAVVD
jgi:hypothetical protein